MPVLLPRDVRNSNSVLSYRSKTIYIYILYISLTLFLSLKTRRSHTSLLSTGSMFSRRELDELRISEGAVSSQHMKFVVKLFVTTVSPNYSMPWQMEKEERSSSTGFVISKRRILTNAHCVAYQTSVKIRKQGSAKKFVARVLAVGHDCDLALLTVDDKDFWTGDFKTDCLTLNHTLPPLQSSVTVIGYPTGGDNISITAGVISRVDIQQYSHSYNSLLTIQIDAAINSGNSGGPCFHGEHVVGICFETLDDSENIGYIIPIQVVEHFLRETANGQYVGFGMLGASWQSVENECIRESLKMKSHHSGPMITETTPLSHAHKVLKKKDVVLSVDNVSVADDGTIEFRATERLSFKYLLTKKFVGDYCAVRVLRNGKEKNLKVRIVKKQSLIPHHLYDKRPSYYVIAGLCFTVLSEDYMKSEHGSSWLCKAPIRFVKEYMYGKKTSADEQIVILNQILSHDVNHGYSDDSFAPRRVFKVNGVKINNISHLVDVVENKSTKHKFLNFDLSDNACIVMRKDRAFKSNAEIQKAHSIEHLKSEDLRHL